MKDFNHNATDLLVEHERKLQSLVTAFIGGDVDKLEALKFARACYQLGVGILPSKIIELERWVITLTLEHHDGNMQATAEVLGITKSTLYRKVGEYGLSPSDFRHRTDAGATARRGRDHSADAYRSDRLHERKRTDVH